MLRTLQGIEDYSAQFRREILLQINDISHLLLYHTHIEGTLHYICKYPLLEQVLVVFYVQHF